MTNKTKEPENKVECFAFVYIGDCKAGFVEFKYPQETIRFPKGEPVEFTNKHLAGKLANNDCFKKVG